eukprot:TRINITY_DN1190_c3_g1_i1.p1 TRINITY_DN1190_c3_g1~~TRINITY_DN1190_c3_g1_i1.p1  ORF type:complete len:496 (+),score=265.60 TRINITY_DN1190_c3_g1_i1:347-1834(+)
MSLHQNLSHQKFQHFSLSLQKMLEEWFVEKETFFNKTKLDLEKDYLLFQSKSQQSFTNFSSNLTNLHNSFVEYQSKSSSSLTEKLLQLFKSSEENIKNFNKSNLELHKSEWENWSNFNTPLVLSNNELVQKLLQKNFYEEKIIKNDKPVPSWLKSWLSERGYAQYIDNFHNHGFDNKFVVSDISDTEFENLNIELPGHKKGLQFFIKELKDIVEKEKNDVKNIPPPTEVEIDFDEEEKKRYLQQKEEKERMRKESVKQQQQLFQLNKQKFHEQHSQLEDQLSSLLESTLSVSNNLQNKVSSPTSFFEEEEVLEENSVSFSSKKFTLQTENVVEIENGEQKIKDFEKQLLNEREENEKKNKEILLSLQIQQKKEEEEEQKQILLLQQKQISLEGVLSQQENLLQSQKSESEKQKNEREKELSNLSNQQKQLSSSLLSQQKEREKLEETLSFKSTNAPSTTITSSNTFTSSSSNFSSNNEIDIEEQIKFVEQKKQTS